MTQTLFIVVLSIALGVTIVMLLRRRGGRAPVTNVFTSTVADRIRAVGKLAGLEVHAKEIATSTKGWSWVPPLLLSQAKIAMIFHFEKQYFVDLSRLAQSDVELIDNAQPGADRARYRITLPPIEGVLRLVDVTPYDIQAGRMLGLFDVIQMDAQTQRELMQAAQEQAGDLFRQGEGRYIESARRSIQHHLEALFKLFDVDIEARWEGGTLKPAGQPALELGDTIGERLTRMAQRAS